MSSAEDHRTNARARSAYLRRAVESIDTSDGPLAVLAQLHGIADHLESAIHGTARDCVAAGESYTAIGQALDITRQAARKRYPDRSAT